MKEEAARIPKKPKEPDKFLEIPPSLRNQRESDDESWASDEWSIVHAENYQMKESIENAMKFMGYKTRAEMKLIMKNYEKKKKGQEKKWRKLSDTERKKFFDEKTAIAKLRSDWTKAYDVTKRRFLSLTPSFIPDLRYDRVSKQFIGCSMDRKNNPEWQASKSC